MKIGKFTVPDGSRELRIGEAVKPTDRYYNSTSMSGDEIQNTAFWKSNLVYGEGILVGPSGDTWIVVRPNAGDEWILISKTPAPYLQRVLYSNGRRIHISERAFGSDTHWQPLPANPLPPPPPDTTFVLNGDHSVLVKGDKSGVMVGCSKNSFVPAAKVKELAALL